MGRNIPTLGSWTISKFFGIEFLKYQIFVGYKPGRLYFDIALFGLYIILFQLFPLLFIYLFIYLFFNSFEFMHIFKFLLSFAMNAA